MVNEFTSVDASTELPGLHVNPPYSVMEKLKEQSQQRSKREVGDNDPSYMISKGPFSLNEDTLYDGPVIELKGPQQDQSRLAENGAEKERKEEGKICRLIGAHRVDE